jgi:hypothetical protein
VPCASAVILPWFPGWCWEGLPGRWGLQGLRPRKARGLRTLLGAWFARVVCHPLGLRSAPVRDAARTLFARRSPYQGFGQGREQVDDPVRGPDAGGLVRVGDRLWMICLHLHRWGLEPLGGRPARLRSSGSGLVARLLAFEEVQGRRAFAAPQQGLEVVLFAGSY